MPQITKIFFLLLLLFESAHAAESSTDLLSLANGAVLVEASGEYGPKWSAISIIDDSSEYGWSSADGVNRAFPNSFVIELNKISQLDQFVIDNRLAQESQYPGISLRHFSLSSSTQSPEGPFTQLLTAEAKQGERHIFHLKQDISSKWIKLDVITNWGYQAYTEIMELEAYGIELDSPSVELLEQDTVFKMYESIDRSGKSYLMHITKQGVNIQGCYDYQEGEISGQIDGRTLLLTWQQGPGVGGATTMVVTSDGSFINGLWYRNGALGGNWFGEKVSSEKAKCSERKFSSLGQKLNEQDKVVVYGLYFDTSSASLNSKSETMLNSILSVLRDDPALKISITGHTDADGSNELNQALSTKRAESVVLWLVNKGVSMSRLSAFGRGQSEPVASNDTRQGKALNRRVEIKKQH
jgi:outer membrane protein OmpA-like peptidoglycan-associated protein